jgi:hypothetical protein
MKHLHKNTLPSGELSRFRLLYRDSGFSPSDEATALTQLHAILSSTRHPDEFPWAPLATIRVIDVIYHKYTPDSYKGRGPVGKAIEDVVVGGRPITSLDLPTLIYATRNWTVHGSLLDSSFRGAPQQYQLYITIITKALAATLGGYAVALEKAL